MIEVVTRFDRMNDSSAQVFVCCVRLAAEGGGAGEEERGGDWLEMSQMEHPVHFGVNGDEKQAWAFTMMFDQVDLLYSH